MTFPPQDWQYPQALSPQAPAPVAEPEPPASLRRAAALMYVGSALSFVSTVVGGVTVFNLLRDPGMFGPFTMLPVAIVVLGGLVPCGLWLWMAWKTGAGREWTRALSSVFFGFGCLGFLVALGRGPGLPLLLGGAEWLAGLAALVLLYQRDSSRFFAMSRYARAMRQPPPPGYGQQR